MSADLTAMGRSALIDEVKTLRVRADRAEKRAWLYAHHAGLLQHVASEAGASKSRILAALASVPVSYDDIEAEFKKALSDG